MSSLVKDELLKTTIEELRRDTVHWTLKEWREILKRPEGDLNKHMQKLIDNVVNYDKLLIEETNKRIEALKYREVKITSDTYKNILKKIHKKYKGHLGRHIQIMFVNLQSILINILLDELEKSNALEE